MKELDAFGYTVLYIVYFIISKTSNTYIHETMKVIINFTILTIYWHEILLPYDMYGII